MMQENHLPDDPEAAAADNRGLEDVQQQDEEEAVHDQLPSVEEYKANAQLDNIAGSSDHHVDGGDDGAPEKSRGKCRCLCYSCACICLSLVLIIVLAVVFGTVDEGPRVRKVDPSSNKSPPTLAPGTYKPRFDDVKKYLALFSDAADLDEEGSPQHRAAKWIADLDIAHMDFEDDSVAFQERYALAVFYYAFDGPKWPLHLGFLGGEDACEWNQVGFGSTEKAKHVGAYCKESPHVKELFFPERWLKGQFPPELKLLKHLEYISVYNSEIDGPFPTVFRDMENLKYLALHFCGLSGSLPNWLGEMTALTSLVLSNNAFHGSLPTSIAELTNLEQLFLDDQGFEGDIEMLKPLTNMKSLLIEDNKFKGTLSDSLFESWKHLEILDASTNNLTKTIPDSLFTLKNLTVLDLHGNQLTGSIPEIPAANKALRFLALHENLLKATIPDSLSNLHELEHLDLSSNALTGDFPTTLGTLKSLAYFFASFNSFTEGNIPTFLKHLVNLEDLSLKATARKGTIPTWIGEMTSLKLLDLDSNDLHGTIPSELGSLSDLKFLLLNRNNLHGRIPNEFASLSTLDFILLERNNFNSTAKHICEREKKPEVFMADCEELDCTCCTACCTDGETTDQCEDQVWLGGVDPIWETKYERVFYQFEKIDFKKKVDDWGA